MPHNRHGIFFKNKFLSGPDNISSGPGHISSGPDHILSGPDHILSGPDRIVGIIWSDMKGAKMENVHIPNVIYPINIAIK